MELLGLKCFTKRPTKFEQFKKDLNSLQLPNTLWASHIEPKFTFAAFLHLDPHNLSAITVDKALMLTFDRDNITCRVYLNGDAVDVPELDLKIETVAELEHFLLMFEKLTLCNGSTTDCRKFTKPGHSGDFCVKCSSTKIGSFDAMKQNRSVLSFKGLGFSNDIKCEACGKCFAEPSQLKEHSVIHLPNYRFGRNSISRSKSRRIGGSSICGKYANTVCEERHADSPDRSLNIHKRPHSTINYNHPCSFCGKCYTTESSLETHIKTTHREDKPHKCTICDRGFIYPRLLDVHMKKHIDNHSFTCSICGNSFEKKSHLNMHKKIHEKGKTFECPTCSKRFKSLGNLNSHKRVHEDETVL